MKKITYLIILFFSLTFKAQQVPDLEVFSLKNGLKIYFLKYGKIEAMNISVVINSGKKNEVPGQQGYNSMVAQLVLQGNKKFSEGDQNDKAFSLGAELMTGSSYDNTSISGNFLSKDANIALDLMSAAIQQPVFDKDKVAQYVAQLSDYNNPRKMDIDDMTHIYSNLNIYGLENPLGRSIYKTQLKQITPEKLKEFHAFNYTPKNTKIIICGNFNSAEVKTLIETYFGNWQSAYGEVNGVSLDHPSIKKQEIFFVNRTAATQCALLWTKNAPPIKDKDALAFTIANMIFNQVLFREIREKGGKTYGIRSNYRPSQFSNLVSIGCSVRSNEMLNTINLFDKTLKEFSSANFTRQEFDTEITSLKTRLSSMEYPEDVAAFYNPILYDFNTRKNILTDLNNLKMEDVQKVVKKYFTSTSYKLGISGDEMIVASQLEKIKDLKKYTATDLEIKN